MDGTAFFTQVQTAFTSFKEDFDIPYADILEMPTFDFLKFEHSSHHTYNSINLT